MLTPHGSCVFLCHTFQVYAVPFFMFRISCLCWKFMFYVYADAHRYEYALRLCLCMLYAYGSCDTEVLRMFNASRSCSMFHIDWSCGWMLHGVHV